MQCIIDELKICYSTGKDDLKCLEKVETGCYTEVFGHRLYRGVNDRFRFYFEVIEEREPVAQLKFGHHTDTDDSVMYVYFKVLNHILYNEERLRRVLRLPSELGLVFNNFTAIDLAFDSSLNIPTLIKKMMRDRSVTTIINGKAVRDRNLVLRGVYFEYSSTLNRLNHPTVTFKQAKAVNKKSAGITVQAYDKKAEIDNCSGKQYILDYHGRPKRLYRLEVRLHNQELKDYFAKRHVVPGIDILFDRGLLNELFRYHLGAVIRFTRGRKKLDWGELLEMRCQGI